MLVLFCLAARTASSQYSCTVKNFNTSNGLPLNEITAMTMDYSGYLWLGTRNGPIRYDGASLKFFLRQSKNDRPAAYLSDYKPGVVMLH